MSTAIRDPLADHLITPQNSALILIDYQPDQVKAVRSMDQDLLVEIAAARNPARAAQLNRSPRSGSQGVRKPRRAGLSPSSQLSRMRSHASAS